MGDIPHIKDLLIGESEESNNYYEENDLNEILSKNMLKKGVQLRKCDREWERVNEVFRDTLSKDIDFNERVLAKGRKNDFRIPTWMKTLNEPSHNFNLDPPSYIELTKVIMRMMPGASLCPLDQISVIQLKKRPNLRTYLWRIISSVWTRAELPNFWKQGIIFLAYKKGFDTDLTNFQPITLLPVMSKIFTFFIRNGLYNFVAENKYIESNVQKGFWDVIFGCYEHP